MFVEVMLYAVIDYSTGGDTMWSLVGVFLLDIAIQFVVSVLSDSNVSKKTLVDGRFLL